MKIKQLMIVLACMGMMAAMAQAAGGDRARSRDASCGKECICPCDPTCTGEQKKECNRDGKGCGNQDRRQARDGSCAK